MYADSFQCCERVDSECVLCLEVERVILHNLLFFTVNVLVVRRLVVYDGRCGCDDFDACMAGELLWFIGEVEIQAWNFLFVSILTMPFASRHARLLYRCGWF